MLSFWIPWARPNIVGRFGPVMSASTNPTRAPALASATAMFEATVDLPTPPLLEATAMMFLTPSMGFWPSFGEDARTLAPHSMATVSMPIGRSARSTSCWMVSLSGQAGVVSSMLMRTAAPSRATSLTIPRRTMEACSSGSLTVLSAAMTASWVTAPGAVMRSEPNLRCRAGGCGKRARCRSRRE